jgi:hypothetical protein
LSTIDDVVNSAQSYREQLNVRKADVERKKAEHAGKPMPLALEREAITVDIELAKQTDLLARKKREAAEVQAKYDAILERWRELTSNREALEAAMSIPDPPPGASAKAPAKK